MSSESVGVRASPEDLVIEDRDLGVQRGGALSEQSGFTVLEREAISLREESSNGIFDELRAAALFWGDPRINFTVRIAQVVRAVFEGTAPWVD